MHCFVLGVSEKTAKSDCQLRHVCPQVATRLPVKDIHLIWYLISFRKSVEKILVPLKSDKINGYFVRRPINTFDQISLTLSYNEKNVSTTAVQNKKTRGLEL